jgi:hypothetical protein
MKVFEKLMPQCQKAGQNTTSLNKTNFWAIFENDQKCITLSSRFGKNVYIQTAGRHFNVTKLSKYALDVKFSWH